MRRATVAPLTEWRRRRRRNACTIKCVSRCGWPEMSLYHRTARASMSNSKYVGTVANVCTGETKKKKLNEKHKPISGLAGRCGNRGCPPVALGSGSIVFLTFRLRIMRILLALAALCLKSLISIGLWLLKSSTKFQTSDLCISCVMASWDQLYGAFSACILSTTP